MKRYIVAVMLCLMAVGVLVAQGQGLSPDDPVILSPGGQFEFEFEEVDSTPPNDITYSVWVVYSPSDSSSVATVPNVTNLVPGQMYHVEGMVAGDPGNVVRLSVWAYDATTGEIDGCHRWGMKSKHQCGGCWLRAQ